jgi:hypothetical protein
VLAVAEAVDQDDEREVGGTFARQRDGGVERDAVPGLDEAGALVDALGWRAVGQAERRSGLRGWRAREQRQYSEQRDPPSHDDPEATPRSSEAGQSTLASRELRR